MLRALILLIFRLAVSVAVAQQPALMPWPSNLLEGNGRFVLEPPFTVQVLPASGLPGHRVGPAVDRLFRRLSERTGQDLSVPGDPREVKLFIRWQRQGQLVVGEDETYTLVVEPGHLEIKAATDLGVLRGLSTLYQLLTGDAHGWWFPACTITDAPRFPWRGLLLDVCRHAMPREVVLRQLDGLELVKMNVLHLHLTEDQGFRIESLVHPELHRLGSEGVFLSQADIRHIIHEADLRGIRVIPEFDLPGHATSWFVSHPELASAPGPYAIETRFGVFDPTFDPTQEATYDLLDRFLGEMAVLFPDPYMHIGGDENNGRQWEGNVAIREFMRKEGLNDNHALQAYFNTRLYAILKKHGKRMIGWDEIAEGELPVDVTIQSWRGKEGLVAAARMGRDVILSNGWYIDLCQPASYHHANDPLPTGIALTEEQQRHVLGGEATMWSELVDARNVDTRIWPRTAAIAERLWSPGTVADTIDMYIRLESVSAQLDAIGMRHKSAQFELLRGIAGGDDVDALKVFVDILSPIQGYQRHAVRKGGYHTRTPLTALVDAAVPDPLPARAFEREVAEYLVSGDRTKIDVRLKVWAQACLDLLQRTEVTARLSPGEQQLLLALTELLVRVGPTRPGAPAPGTPGVDDEAALQFARPEATEVELRVLPALERLLRSKVR